MGPRLRGKADAIEQWLPVPNVYTTPVGTPRVLVCECDDIAAPALSSLTGAQASTSTATVTGTTDEAGTVYCVVHSGVPPTSSNVKSSGQSTAVGSAGSFSVTVTGVSGEGSKRAYCVGEDAAGNLGGTPVNSPLFDCAGGYTPRVALGC